MNARTLLALVGWLPLALAACGAPPTHAESRPAVTQSPPPASSPAPLLPTPAPLAPPVIVGLDQHSTSPSTVVLMRPDGSVVATRTLPGTWLVGEHAVGAYLLVGSDGSPRAWTVDASGEVGEVAATAAAILSHPDLLSDSPLIVDSRTAVVVRCPGAACVASELDLRAGTVRDLLTVSRPPELRGSPLQVLDLAADGHTVWLRRVGPAPANGSQGPVNVIGIDLGTGVTSVPARSASITDGGIAISRDGGLVAGLEFADSGRYTVGRLHLDALDSGTDTDVQGAAEYASEWSGLNSIRFTPDGETVAWWGPASLPGPPGGTTVLDVAGTRASGRTLLRVASTTHEIVGAFWLDSATLVIQTDSTTTPGVFQGADLQTLAIDVTSGAQRPLPGALHNLVAVLR